MDTRDSDCAYDLGWRDLTAEQRTAAKLCGYSKSAWDNDKDVEIEQRSWAEVSEEQRAALSCLGYTQQTWNASCSSPGCKGETSSDDYFEVPLTRPCCL